MRILQVVLCQINIFCHQLTQNTMTDIARFKKMFTNCSEIQNTVKLGDKERFDKEQIGAKEPFPVTNLQFIS